MINTNVLLTLEKRYSSDFDDIKDVQHYEKKTHMGKVSCSIIILMCAKVQLNIIRVQNIHERVKQITDIFYLSDKDIILMSSRNSNYTT